MKSHEWIPKLVITALFVFIVVMISLAYMNKKDCTRWDNIASKGLCGFNAEEHPHGH